jgi:nitrous oxidase accessory protein
MGVSLGKSVVLLLVLTFLTASCITVPLPVNAEPKTLVVPDDYPTIADAVGNAVAGDTVFVKRGTYEEQTLEISKPLSLIGEGANQTTINLHPPYNETWILTQSFRTYANAITINTNDAELKGFTISANGGDIYVTGDRTQIIKNTIAAELIIAGSHSKVTENTMFRLSLSGSYSNIIGNNIASGNIRLKGSYNELAHNSVLVDIIMEYADSNIISNNTCTRLLLGYHNNCSYNVVSGNRIEPRENMGQYGMLIGGSHNVFYNNHIENLTQPRRYAVWLDGLSAENNTFYHNNFINNNNTIYVENANLTAKSNFWDNGKEGNYWDDYTGTDSNRDGIGDTPYVIDANNQDSYPLMFPFDIEGDVVVLPSPEPFLTALVVAAVATVAVIGLVLAIYFRKRNRQAENDSVKKS